MSMPYAQFKRMVEAKSRVIGPFTHAKQARAFDRIWYRGPDGVAVAKVVKDVDLAAGNVTIVDADGSNPQTVSPGSGEYWIDESTRKPMPNKSNGRPGRIPNRRFNEDDVPFDIDSDLPIDTPADSISGLDAEIPELGMDADLDAATFGDTVSPVDVDPTEPEVSLESLLNMHEDDDEDADDEEDEDDDEDDLEEDEDEDEDDEDDDEEDEEDGDDVDENLYSRHRRRTVHEEDADEPGSGEPENAVNSEEDEVVPSGANESRRLSADLKRFLKEMDGGEDQGGPRSDAQSPAVDAFDQLPNGPEQVELPDVPSAEHDDEDGEGTRGGDPVSIDSNAAITLDPSAPATSTDEIEGSPGEIAGGNTAINTDQTMPVQKEHRARVRRDITNALSLVERGTDPKKLAKALLMGGA